MKKLFIAAAILVMTGIPAFVASSDDKPENTAALVNGSSISTFMLDKKVEEALMEMMTRGQAADPSQIRKNILETLINNELLYQESIRSGYKPTEQKVETQFDSISGQFESEDAFKSILLQRGYSVDTFRDELVMVISINDYINEEVAPSVEVSDDEILGYYNDNPDRFREQESIRASHILIRVEDAADDQKKTAHRTIKDIKKKIDKGESFEDLAKTYSDCPSGSQGGDLGYFERGRMVQPFEDAAFALELGEVSDIVETSFGYHLIKLMEKKPARTIPLDEVRIDVERMIAEQKLYAELGKIVDKLKSEATIERYL